jgi:hypothetical protein
MDVRYACHSFAILIVGYSSPIFYSSAQAQPLTDDQIAMQIEKQRRMVAVDEYGCIKYPADDEIVVCGPDLEKKRQRLPRSDAVDTDRIHRGEAVSTTRAAAKDRSGCGRVGIDIGCTILPSNGVSMGRAPPPMPPDFADVIRGLPDQETVVPEGSASSENPTDFQQF